MTGVRDGGRRTHATGRPDLGSPEGVTVLQRALWAERGSAVGEQFDVSPCPFDAGELARLAREGRRVAFLPAQLATQAQRHLLGQVFPRMASYAAAVGNVFGNDVERAGWFDYDAAPDAPLTDMTEQSLMADLDVGGRRLLNLNEYIVASQDTKALTGHHLDERSTWARIGTRVDGRLIAARFDGAETAQGLGDEPPVDGSLLVAYDVTATDRFPVLGARATTVALGARGQVAVAVPPAGVAEVSVPGPADSSPDPAEEWARQVELLLRCGFHRELGLSAEEYRASLPRPGSAPEVYREALGALLVVETRIPWRRRAELAGIRLSALSASADYHPVDAAWAPPPGPYVGWFNAWGQLFPDPVAPPDARDALATALPGAELVAAGVDELIAMELARPEYSRAGRFFEGIGQIVGPNTQSPVIDGVTEPRSPCIFYWRHAPEIGANLHPIAFSIFRPLVRGSIIRTAG